MNQHITNQQVTPQISHQRQAQNQNQNQQNPAMQQQRHNPNRMPQQAFAPNAQNLGAGITHDQMMLINSMQALMGSANQRSTSNSRKQNQKKHEKKRLPSLHIGNLPAKFYDLDLYKMIKQKGFQVVKAIVVVDKKTNKSLNYGYAQFVTEDAAVECQKVLNNAMIEDKVITVSLQQIDNKPNPKANVLVRNLATTLTQKDVFEHYKAFGEIQKCKLECYADGLSRGFAYVQYASEEHAADAIAKTNGSEFEGKKLEVFAHVKRADNAEEGKSSIATGNNIFVQGFAKNTNEAQLTAMFKDFGEISSALIQKNDSDDSLSNSAYVCFKNSTSASSAIDKLNKQKGNDGSYLFVSHHVAKRQNELAHDKTKTAINQNINKNFASNLFVKYIPSNISDQDLHNLFVVHGPIISIKLKVKGESRFNHAYVLYEKVESCQAAIRALDKTRPFGNQPIDVEFWVSKVDLVAEREAKQKEQMQKYISSAIYDIKNELMGGRKPYRGAKRNNQQQRVGTGQGAQGGRGGKPTGQSQERKNSKDARPKSQNKDKLGAPIQGQSAQQFTPVPLPAAANVAQMQTLQTIEEKKQFVGNMIYPCIQQAYGDIYVGKITGMLLDEKVVNLDLLVTDQKYLSQIAGQAKNMLEAQSKQ